MSTTLSVEHVARIEGHGTITVEVDGGEVRDIRMDIVEPARYFESMVVGRHMDEVPLITSRICGICSPNHVITAIKALESALDIEVSERTVLLRKLLVYGSYLQNHATHLYLFAAPDYVKLPSVFPLAETHPEIVERALRIKKLGNDLTTLVGGRPIHPVTAVLGGFTSEPDPAGLAGFRVALDRIVEDAVATAELFSAFEEYDFATAGEMLALYDSSDYAVYDGSIAALDGGWAREVAEYRSVIEETVVGHSNAKHSTVDGRTFMVGALPRINLSRAQLMPRAKAAVASVGLDMPSRNTFMNNRCQAIELIDAAERCATYIDRLLDGDGTSAVKPFVLAAGRGAGATEAPRGTLYHSYEIDAGGVVRAADIITPTAQNLANLDADMRAFAPQVVGLPREEFLLAVERLVRAYDPCLSCSVH